MEWYLALAVIAAGLAAGFINTLAGSGSLITLSLLIFMGVPATVANGSNRAGVLFQNLTAAASFRQQQVLNIRFVFTIFALAVFVINGQVWWGIGILLAIGNAAGGWIAARMAVKHGAAFVRWLLIAIVALSALQLLGIFEFIMGLF